VAVCADLRQTTIRYRQVQVSQVVIEHGSAGLGWGGSGREWAGVWVPIVLGAGGVGGVWVGGGEKRPVGIKRRDELNGVRWI